jgi:branched-chain amino acid aminotransferase
MEIKVIQTSPEKRKAKPTDEAKLGFGKIFTDHFFTMPYHAGRGWHDPLIEPYRQLQLDPTAMCLHYAQEIFEGMKAYRGKDGAIFFFRPLENIRRMNVSAERLCMPQVDEALFMEALTKLICIEKDWIPRGSGTSLYIRPTMIAHRSGSWRSPCARVSLFHNCRSCGGVLCRGVRPDQDLRH